MRDNDQDDLMLGILLGIAGASACWAAVCAALWWLL